MTEPTEKISLVSVTWVIDEAMDEWVLVAQEPTPRGERDGVVDHWMKEETHE